MTSLLKRCHAILYEVEVNDTYLEMVRRTIELYQQISLCKCDVSPLYSTACTNCLSYEIEKYLQVLQL